VLSLKVTSHVSLKINSMFPAIIVIRILFAACMVFVIGYMFGNFAKSKALAAISKTAAIAGIVLFIVANGILMRSGGWHRSWHHQYNHCYDMPKDCYDMPKDSVINVLRGKYF